MIVFENKGILPVECITTFGVTIKKQEGAFGYFGTGLKYAIAILLRTQQSIAIQTGGRKFVFTSKPTMIRGKSFDLVQMNGKSLGFTTEVGKDWKVWQAYRELYCNCMDEGGRVYTIKRAPNYKTTHTYIICKGKEIVQVHETSATIILKKDPFYTSHYPALTISTGSSTALYYQTIKAYELADPSLFTYNFQGSLKLTEDRTIKQINDAELIVVNVILNHQDADFIRKVITAPKGTFENSLDFTKGYRTPSDTFLTTVSEEIKAVNMNLNPTAHTVYVNCKHNDIEPEPIKELSEAVCSRLIKAINFCKKIGFEVDAYPIIVTEDIKDSTVYALAKNGKIFLTKALFSEGMKMLAMALIEEHTHLKYRYDDESRELQTFFLKNIVTLGENLTDTIL